MSRFTAATTERESDVKRSLYHYTVGVGLRSMLDDELIKPATAFVPDGQRPAVWCTFSREWEPTCNKQMLDERTGKLIGLSKEETGYYGEGLFRIEVDPAAAPHSWRAFRRLSGCTAHLAKALHSTAVAKGSDPKQWRVSFEPIPMERWLGVEGWSFEEDRWLSLGWEPEMCPSESARPSGPVALGTR